jgi:hypothetical protein
VNDTGCILLCLFRENSVDAALLNALHERNGTTVRVDLSSFDGGNQPCMANEIATSELITILRALVPASIHEMWAIQRCSCAMQESRLKFA